MPIMGDNFPVLEKFVLKKAPILHFRDPVRLFRLICDATGQNQSLVATFHLSQIKFLEILQKNLNFFNTIQHFCA